MFWHRGQFEIFMRFLFLIIYHNKQSLSCLWRVYVVCRYENYMRNRGKSPHMNVHWTHACIPAWSLSQGWRTLLLPFKGFTQQWNVCVRINDERISITTGSRRECVWSTGPQGWEIVPKGRLGQTGWFPYCIGVQKSCFLSLQSSAAVWHTHTHSLWTCFRACTGKTGLSPSSNLRSLVSDYSQCLIKRSRLI